VPQKKNSIENIQNDFDEEELELSYCSLFEKN
jgi:hypothetical protein